MAPHMYAAHMQVTHNNDIHDKFSINILHHFCTLLHTIYSFCTHLTFSLARLQTVRIYLKRKCHLFQIIFKPTAINQILTQKCMLGVTSTTIFTAVEEETTIKSEALRYWVFQLNTQV